MSTGLLYLTGGVILDGLTLEQRLRSSSRLRTFTEWALLQPDLAATLRGTEPHTVFAPTTEAIENVADNVMEALRAQVNSTLFSRVMAMHFVEGALRSTDMPDGASIPTLEGSTLEVTNTPSAFRVEGRDILVRDVVARNGILHLVEGLLTPDVDAFDAAILRGMPEYTDVIRHAGLEWLVRGPGPISVVAFTDEAIEGMPDLLSRPDLPTIIRYHIANGLIGPIQVGLTFVPLEGPVRTVTGHGGDAGFLLDGLPFFNDFGPVTNGRLYGIGGIQPPPDPLAPRRRGRPLMSLASPYE
jgi:uncharacterized surface protein with fasciclin (FAS1) repeats